MKILIACLFFVQSACVGGKFDLSCDNSSVIETGKNFYQPLIDAAEKFKSAHGNYPSDVFQLVPEFLDKIPGAEENSKTAVSADESGRLYGNSDINSQMIAMRPDIETFYITFYFRNDGKCSLNKNGACSYDGKSKQWSCK